jgi:hypothetical protein
MSMAYRIRAASSEERTIHVEDGVCSSLEILDVLPRDNMKELLAAELEKRGFTRKGDKLKRQEKDGIEIEVDVKEGTITARIGQGEKVGVKVERSGVARNANDAEAQARLDDSVKREVERQFQEKQEKMRGEATKKLEGRLKDLKKELDQVVNRVTAEALKQKARSMGEIEEIAEDKESGAVTIKVRV